MNYKDFEKEAISMKDIGMNLIPELVKIRIPYAKENLQRGISYFCRTSDIVWETGYDEIAEWLSDNKGKGLLVVGDVGLGKSIICTKVIPVLIRHYHGLILRTYFADNINQQYKEILTKKMVCIDDMGKEGMMNEFGNKKVAFDEIVDNAERNGNLLVITTNLVPEEIESKYGKRTLDRLKAITKIVIVKGVSNRK